MNEAKSEPALFIVFGGTGDLSRNKLMPAIYHLKSSGEIDCRNFIVLGTARSEDFNDDSFRDWTREALKESGIEDIDEERWCTNLFYQALGESGEAEYKTLLERIERIEKEHDLPGNRIFYLALPHKAFPDIIEKLGTLKFKHPEGWTRLVIEKPFGHDLASAQELNRLVHQYFDESEVYRIDHYLGKETVQNLLVFRFANSIFESQWNRDHIDSIELTMSESSGVEGRAKYYDKSGALRDMIQNHMTQLLCLVAMEVPVAFEAGSVRQEKIKVLRSIAPINQEEVILGQYGSGKIDGKEVKGYQDQKGIAEDSKTETFVAMRLHVDNWRWQGVPFGIRTGKRLPRRLTQITVRFRQPPVCLFGSEDSCQISRNMLNIILQPDEGFVLTFDVKEPGEPLSLRPLPLRFHYREAFGPLADAYATLLSDILDGDQTLFVHAEEVEQSWQLYTPLLEQQLDVLPYEAGTWGPIEANHLIPRPRD